MGVAGNPSLGACQQFSATDKSLDLTACAQGPLQAAFSLGKSPMEGY